MTINFQQPKYMLPLIVLPFIFIFNFLFLEFFSVPKASNSLEEKEGIITSIPKPDMEKLKIDDKLSNMKKDFKEYKDLSALSDDLVEEKDIKTSLIESVYNEKEADEILKLQDSLQELKKVQKLEKSIPNYFDENQNKPYSAKENREFSDFQEQKEALLEKEKTSPKSEYLKEMKEIDSILNPHKYTSNLLETQKNLQIQIPQKIYQVQHSKAINHPYFNTLSVKKTSEFKIEGLLDQKLKVSQGSRIRIKLASDIRIDSISLKKNQYLYGNVSGFSTQRLFINISNITIHGKIYEVNLSIYDLDGMRGLHVPSSNFREFTKELGEQTANNLGQGLEQQNSDPTQEQKQSFFIDLATNITRATTQTAGQLIRKNSVHLKYNTRVYLINEQKK